MRVWLLTVGEPLPTDTGGDRTWRTGLLANQLLKRGHEVVWWSSAFDHFQRRQRLRVNRPIPVSDGLTVWHLDGVPYARNISVARIRNHRQVARNFREQAPHQPRPDVILSSLPTLELCCAAVDYGDAHGVPVALDIRDLWPDVLVDFAPRAVRGLAQGALHWMTRQLRYSTQRATALLGVTDEFVQWGLHSAQRDWRPVDRAFSMAYTGRAPSPSELERAHRAWRERGIEDGSHQFLVCFFGTLGWMFDFDTVVRAAAHLRDAAPHIRFVICGAGDRLEYLRRAASDLPNILLPGRVDASEIWWLLRRSSVGLAPYRPFGNFQHNLPNKPIEYLSAGVPIVASRLEVLARLLQKHQCGISYDPGDAQGLAQALVELSQHDDRRLSMSRRAETLYRGHFVAERVYDDMAAHLEQLAASGNADRSLNSGSASSSSTAWVRPDCPVDSDNHAAALEA